MAVINPYSGLDLNALSHIRSMSHDHGGTSSGGTRLQDNLDRGMRHFAWSNYSRALPSDPSYPEDYYGSAPVYPASRWGVDVFDNDPTIIETPNAEQTGTAGSSGHYLSIGSLAGSIGHNYDHFDGVESASDADTWIGDQETGEPFQYESREAFFNYVLYNLQFDDAGGIYAAHSGGVARNYLDSIGDKFLGTDMYNDRRDSNDSTINRDGRGYQVAGWDEILKTGRRCWAFGEADRGRRACNVLLLDDFTNYTAQKAYRDGRFYTKLDKRDSGLKFTKLNDTGSKFEVETEGAYKIRIITERGVVAEGQGNSLEYTYPTKDGSPDITYVRAEALAPEFDENTYDFSPGPALGEEGNEFEWPTPNYRDGVRYEDEIYSQAIMFRDAYSGTTAIAERFWDELPSRPLAKINEAWEKYETALVLVDLQPAGQGAPEDETDVRNRLQALARKIRGERNKIYYAAGII